MSVQKRQNICSIDLKMVFLTSALKAIDKETINKKFVLKIWVLAFDWVIITPLFYEKLFVLVA